VARSNTRIIVTDAVSTSPLANLKTVSAIFAPVKVLGRYFRNRFYEKLRKNDHFGDWVVTKSIRHPELPDAFESTLFVGIVLAEFLFTFLGDNRDCILTKSPDNRIDRKNDGFLSRHWKTVLITNS